VSAGAPIVAPVPPMKADTDPPLASSATVARLQRPRAAVILASPVADPHPARHSC